MDSRLIKNLMHIKTLDLQKQKFDNLVEQNKVKGKKYADMLRGPNGKQ